RDRPTQCERLLAAGPAPIDMQIAARGDRMRRRDLILLLGGTAAGWPLAARGQPADQMRHIGMLMTTDDPEAQVRVAAFRQELQQLGWTDGGNVRIDTR